MCKCTDIEYGFLKKELDLYQKLYVFSVLKLSFNIYDLWIIIYIGA